MFKFLLSLLGLETALIIQHSGFLNFAGCNPNLIIIVFLLIVFSDLEFKFIATLISMAVVAEYFWGNFWTLGSVVIGIFAVIAFFTKKKLTGNRFADFMIAIIVGTLFFYVSTNLTGFYGTLGVIWEEIAYNLALGAVLYGVTYRSFAQ